MDHSQRLNLVALPGLPLVEPGDDLAGLIADGLEAAGEQAGAGDVLVVAQKVVSKAEDRYVDLGTVTPSARAREIAVATGKDARLVEVIVSESRQILRYREGVIIVVHRLGFILANAGVDTSNVEPANGAERVLLLPRDPDATCAQLAEALGRRSGAPPAVVINDSVGRAWRHGTVGIAVGAAGLPALQDLRGRLDLYGRPLEITKVGLADELAAAATLLQGEADEGTPVVLVHGLGPIAGSAGANVLVRAESEDLFR